MAWEKVMATDTLLTGRFLDLLIFVIVGGLAFEAIRMIVGLF